MAERRMFALKIIDSDAFLDMPDSTQNLYFHLSMRADDDGFISNPKKVMRMIGASDDDMKVLLAKRFMLSFDTGIVVVKHWRIHNYIAKDRYTETIYKEEKATLFVKANGAYTDNPESVDNLYTNCIQNDDTGKVRLGKVRKVKKREEAPALPSPLPAPPIQKRDIPTESSKDATARIDRLRTAWNYMGLPECRYTIANFRDYERADCIRAVTFYTDDEIEAAIKNYAGILKSVDHEVFPYKGFTTFMAKGVEQYIDKADPWTIKKRRATEQEQKKAAEYKDRGGFEVPEATCKCCGHTWRTTQSICPKCHYEGGDIEDHKEWYRDRFGHDLE